MNEKDIAPELLERIRADFLALLGDAQQEADTYTAAAAYAELVGSALADAFRRNLTADILPDGRLYWNIADRVVRPLLEEDYARIADAAAAAQQALNRQARIGIAPQRAVLDADRVNGLLNKLAEAERFEDAAWALAEPVRTFSRMAVDDVLKANVDFQGRAGLRPRVVALPKAAAVSGVALWPGHTTTPMFRKMFTAATSAAAAGWNMTPARADGRTCGIKRGQRSRKSFSPVRSLQKHHSLTKSIFPAIFLCRAFSRNICGRLHRVLVLSHMIQAMTWCAMQMK